MVGRANDGPHLFMIQVWSTQGVRCTLNPRTYLFCTPTSSHSVGVSQSTIESNIPDYRKPNQKKNIPDPALNPHPQTPPRVARASQPARAKVPLPITATSICE